MIFSTSKRFNSWRIGFTNNGATKKKNLWMIFFHDLLRDSVKIMDGASVNHVRRLILKWNYISIPRVL